MKAQSLFYFITFFCFVLSGCKKEEIGPENIVGQWYVERYTVYDSGGARASGYYDYEPLENYEGVGVFNFKENGTGNYTFENQIISFTYTVSENTNTQSSSNSSFNGISISGGKNPSTSVINLIFDKSQITSVRSPIIENYYTYNVERYEVFTKTKGTLRFRANLNNTAPNTYSNSDNVEFILTRQ